MSDITNPSPVTVTWNANEAAHHAGVARRTIERRIASGKLDGVKDPVTGEWAILPAAMVAAGFTLRTGPDKPTPAATGGVAVVDGRVAELESELAVLRAENTDLRRRAEVAEAVAAERQDHVAGLRDALSTIKALPAAPQLSRRVSWRGMFS